MIHMCDKMAKDYVVLFFKLTKNGIYYGLLKNVNYADDYSDVHKKLSNINGTGFFKTG